MWTRTPTSLLTLALTLALALALAAPAWAQAPLEVSQGATVIPRGATFDMGSTPVGVDKTRTFTIRNVGSTSVAVGTLSYSNNTNNPGSYSASNLNYGTLAPGETGTFDLTYSSTGPGTVQTEVRLFVGGIPDYAFYVETTAVGAPTIGLTMGTSSPGNITLSPGSSIPIAQAPQGTTLRRVFTVANDGDGPLALGSLSLGSGISTVGSVPSTVAAGSSAAFTLQFSTNTIGSFAGTIAVPHDAPGTANPFSFEIRWSVGDPPPVIRLQRGTTVIPEDGTWNYGSVQVGGSKSETFRIYNDGSAPLTVGTVAIGGNVNNPGSFSVQSTSLSNIPVGSYGTVTLRYDATATGQTTSDIRLFIGGTPQFRWYVTATGVTPSEIRVQRGTTTIAPGGSTTLAQVPQGTTLRQTFDIHNDGGSALSLGSPSFGSGISLVGSYPSSVAPGSSASFTLQFSTTSSGSFSRAVSLPHGAPGTANPYPFTVTWSVGAPPPQIRVQRGGTVIPQDGTWNYGSVLEGGSLVETFRVYNDGSAPFSVSPVSIGSNLADPGDFSIDSSNLLNIQPGSYGTLTLRYDALEVGTTTNSVRLFVGGTSQFRWYVTATGTEPIGPVLRLQLGGNVITNGETIGFGQTGAGQDLTRTFTATNDGDQPLSAVVSLSSNGSDPSTFVVDQNNVANVAPGDSATFVLRFDAGTEGTVTSNVRLFVGGTVALSYYATGTVSPPDFQLSAGPASRTVSPGQNAFYTATVDALYGWNQSVALSASGLPTGVTARFTPTSVTGDGSSELRLATSSSTPGGTWPITLTGSGGGRTRTATVNLVVQQPGFALAVDPNLRTVTAGSSTTYVVNVTPQTGFDSPVDLTVLDLPAGASGSFSPQTLGQGSATLTVLTSSTTPTGDTTLRVRGTGGGVTRTRTVTLRVQEGGANGEPIVDSVSPSEIVSGGVRTLTLQGQNLQGSTVVVPQSQPDPNNPVSRFFPTAQVVSIAPDGTSMQVSVDVTDQRILDFYNLQVDNGVDQAVGQFRVLPPGPLVDFWTPSQPRRGAVYVLSLAGRHLQGAQVAISPSAGLRLLGQDNSRGDQFTAILDIDDGAALGPREIVVTNNGRTIRLPITITLDGPTERSTTNLTASAGSAGTTKGDQDGDGGLDPSTHGNVPAVLFEEVTLRLPQATETVADGLKVYDPSTVSLDATTAQAFNFGIYISYTIDLVTVTYQRTLIYDLDTGEIGDAILQALDLGELRQFGAFVLSFYLDVDLTIYWNITTQGFTFPLFCLDFEIGVEIPGLYGEYLRYNYCVGGQFVQFTSGSTNSIDLDGGPCASVTNGPPQTGISIGQAELTDCCDQSISASSTGVSLFGGGFNINEGEIAVATPAPMCEGGGPPSRLGLYVEVDGNFSLTSPQGDIDAFVPGSRLGGSSALLPQEVQLVAAYLDDNGAVTSPPIGVSQIEFSLEDVSQFKGFAMNMGDDTGPDMTLSGPTTASFEFDNTARVTLQVHDYGGFATAKATAVGGTAGDEVTLRLPKDDDGNLLPDAGWQSDFGSEGGFGQADADTDGTPTGSGDPPYARVGDGFSAYAEYRGFIVRGQHQRTSPRRKDYFILRQNQSQGDLPAAEFAAVGLGPIGELGIGAKEIRINEIELASPAPRFRNMARNWENAASVEPETIPGHTMMDNLQAASLLQFKTTGSGSGDIGGAAPNSGSGGPTTPNSTLFVAVYVRNLLDLGGYMSTGGTNFRQGMYRHVIGHELGHSVHICHRGNVSGSLPGDCTDCGSSLVPLSEAPRVPQFMRHMHTGILNKLVSQSDNPTRQLPSGYTPESQAQVRLHDRGSVGQCVDPPRQ